MEWGSWMKWPERDPHGNSAIDATPSLTTPSFLSSPSSATTDIRVSLFRSQNNLNLHISELGFLITHLLQRKINQTNSPIVRPHSNRVQESKRGAFPIENPQNGAFWQENRDKAKRCVLRNFFSPLKSSIFPVRYTIDGVV